MNIYLFLKFLHILSVVLFVGNIIVTGWWKTLAVLGKSPTVLKFAQRQVTLTDYVFTAVGASLVFITGVGMVHVGKLSFNIPWIWWGLFYFTLSGLLWLAVLIPIQMKQAAMAKNFAEGTEIPALYFKLEKVWIIVGVLATVLPIMTMYLMVLKPL